MIDVDTLSEIRSIKTSLLGIYLRILIFVVFITILVVSLICFTPIKRLIPGYGDVFSHPVFIEMDQSIDRLEEDIVSQQNYIKGLQNMLSGLEPNEGILADSKNPLTRPEKEQKVESSNQTSSPQKFKNWSIWDYDFTAPVKGSISAPFAINDNHFGVDIVAPAESPIKSILPGVVLQSDWTLEHGNVISVQHDHDLISIYKHNSSLLKKTGKRVEAGEVIAIIGNTGKRTNGPHLHFEMWYRGSPKNPEDYISFKK